LRNDQLANLGNQDFAVVQQGDEGPTTQINTPERVEQALLAQTAINAFVDIPAEREPLVADKTEIIKIPSASDNQLASIDMADIREVAPTREDTVVEEKLVIEEATPEEAEALDTDNALADAKPMWTTFVKKLEIEPAQNNCVQPLDGIKLKGLVQGRVIATNLKIRNAPSRGCPVSIILSNGKPLKLLEYSSDKAWSRVEVRLNNGLKLFGWASSRYIEILHVSDRLARLAQANSATGDQVDAVLANFKTYYEAGNSLELTNLYMSEARENKLVGARKIKEIYAQFFRNSSELNLEVNVDDVKQADNHSAIVTGVMQVGRRTFSGGPLTISYANFKIVMVKTKSTYKIAIFDWKETANSAVN
jgi:hypothetical protein